jgi:hypothetical protein
MNTETPFVVTEWEWFKLKLELYSLHYRSELYAVVFDFPSNKEVKVHCRIYGKHAGTMMEEQATRKQQLEYYRGWVRMEKRQINNRLRELPVLRHHFSVEKDRVRLENRSKKTFRLGCADKPGA